ncbi:MAG: Ada metal-binding domain-containing protein [Pyrinomonadaceae bacterium]
MSSLAPNYWPSARLFTEAIQCPGICFTDPYLRETLPAVDRLGMPLVTSGQFAYVYKLKPSQGGGAFAVRCFRGYLGDRGDRYRAIDEHLQAQHIPALASFDYDPQGILVAGRRYPVLVMQWIEGPTLDVYLDEVVEKREVLLHLADEWVKLMGALREARVAHGDLQHGNIIVEHGQLRLVDLDGMFVPVMQGWTSSEMGHQHYQHPARDERLFNSNLDNFSALVIYLSLISLAERPALWREHHDENLLFTKSDFLHTESSALFAKVKELGEEHQKLAEILEEAAKGDPASVPYLLDLVSAKSRLPSWMVAPPEVDVIGKTREAPRPANPPGVAGRPQWTPWEAKRASRNMPSTPVSNTVQSLFSGPTTPSHFSNTTAMTAADPAAIAKNTFTYARNLPKNMPPFSLVFWGLYFFWSLFDLPFGFALFLTVFFVVSICLLYGFIRAIKEWDDAVHPSLNAQMPIPSIATSGAGQLPSARAGYARPVWNRTATPLMNPVAGPVPQSMPPQSALGMSDPIIANRTLGIYHLPTCEWAHKISPKNRVGFSSALEAQNAGYRRCQVCSPWHVTPPARP